MKLVSVIRMRRAEYDCILTRAFYSLRSPARLDDGAPERIARARAPRRRARAAGAECGRRRGRDPADVRQHRARLVAPTTRLRLFIP